MNGKWVNVGNGDTGPEPSLAGHADDPRSPILKAPGNRVDRDKIGTRRPGSERLPIPVSAIHQPENIGFHPVDGCLIKPAGHPDTGRQIGQRKSPSGFLMEKVGASSDHPKASRPLGIQEIRQQPVGMPVFRRRPNLVSRVAGRQDEEPHRNRRRRNRASETRRPVSGIHRRMSRPISQPGGRRSDPGDPGGNGPTRAPRASRNVRWTGWTSTGSAAT